ncbi:transposase family protein [Streptomyces goshikiensis]|uniref:transposase family protein n=1 Tax=Streptomyces goshikiensis TaxID=1942 RepID=UPI0036DEF699
MGGAVPSGSGRPVSTLKCDQVFTDRLLVTLVHLRDGLPHSALTELYDIARSTISGAIGGRHAGCWRDRRSGSSNVLGRGVTLWVSSSGE